MKLKTIHIKILKLKKLSKDIKLLDENLSFIERNFDDMPKEVSISLKVKREYQLTKAQELESKILNELSIEAKKRGQENWNIVTEHYDTDLLKNIDKTAKSININ